MIRQHPPNIAQCFAASKLARRPEALARWLVASLILCGTGCQVLAIPSYRHDSPGDWAGYADQGRAFAAESDSAALQCAPYEDLASEMCDTTERVSLIPPIPIPACLGTRWSAWKAKRAIPPGPDRPRFLPLPTRPMFEPRPGALPALTGLAGGDLAHGELYLASPAPPSLWNSGADSYGTAAATDYGRFPTAEELAVPPGY